MRRSTDSRMMVAQMKVLRLLIVVLCITAVSCARRVPVSDKASSASLSILASTSRVGMIAVIDLSQGSVNWIPTGINGNIQEIETLGDQVFLNVLDSSTTDSPNNGVYQIDFAGDVSVSHVLPSSGEYGRVSSITVGDGRLYVLTQSNLLIMSEDSSSFRNISAANPHYQVDSVEWFAGSLYYVSRDDQLAAFDTTAETTTHTIPIVVADENAVPSAFGVFGVVEQQLLLGSNGKVYLYRPAGTPLATEINELSVYHRIDGVKHLGRTKLIWRIIEYPKLYTKIMNLETGKSLFFEDIRLWDLSTIPNGIEVENLRTPAGEASEH